MAFDPDHEQRKAAGVAMIVAGHSLREAQQATGVHNSTLHRALQALNEGKASAADLHAADQALMAHTYALATEAQLEQLRRLREGGQETRDLNGMAAMSLRAISNYRRWNAPSMDTGEPGSASKLLDRLESMLQSGAELTLSVSKRPPDADAVDVEAEILGDTSDGVGGDREPG